MRKIVIVAGLLMGAALLTGTPAKAAAVGCLCGKIGAPAVCTATIIDCNFKNGGVCIAPCAYEAPKMGKKAHGATRESKPATLFRDKAPSRDGAFVFLRAACAQKMAG